MAKHKKMTAEEDARQQANIDRARELLIKNGGKTATPPSQPKR